METKVNYVLVGVFVLVLSAALIGGVLWLASGKQFGKTYDTYLAYLDESVSGLNLNAPVKYRGVDVGQVNRISLDPANPEQVRLELGIERGTPIKEDTVAVLRVQGLTGIAYVELSGGSRSSPVLRPAKEGAYPVIKTGPSLLLRLDTAVTNLMGNLNRTTENLNTLLDEDNRQSLKHILADLSIVTHALAARKDSIDAGVRNAARTMENSAQASADLPQLIERLNRSADAVEKMAAETARTSISARKTLENIGPDAQRFTGETLPELERLMRDMREVTASLRRTSEQVEQNPAVLLRGKQASKPGPGE